MTPSDKIEANNKIEQKRLNTVQTAKLLRFWLYTQVMLVDINSLPEIFVLPENELSEKAATIKRFGYLLLSSELKK